MKPLRAALLAAFAALVPLAAQHFEDGRLYLPITQYPQGKGAGHIGHGEARMAIVDAHGRQTLLDLPPTLEGRRGICREVATHRDTHYALGMLNHPLFDRVGDRYDEQTQRKRRDRLPHVLYKRVGNGPWQALARLTPDQVRVDFQTFLPLDGDRFLVRTMFPTLEVQGRKVVFALLVPDGRGGMAVELVPGLEGLAEAPLRQTLPVRLADRILLLKATPAGESLALDFRGQHLASPAHPMSGNLAAAAPRSDGQILLQFQGARNPKAQPLSPLHFPAPDAFPARSAQEKLLRAWARSNGARPQAQPDPSSWALLDPATGALCPVPPPQGGVRRPVVGPIRWAVLPNGNLRWHSEIPWRDFENPPPISPFRLPLPVRKTHS